MYERNEDCNSDFFITLVLKAINFPFSMDLNEKLHLP